MAFFYGRSESPKCTFGVRIMTFTISSLAVKGQELLYLDLEMITIEVTINTLPTIMIITFTVLLI